MLHRVGAYLAGDTIKRCIEITEFPAIPGSGIFGYDIRRDIPGMPCKEYRSQTEYRRQLSEK
jgi:hypothetical protein